MIICDECGKPMERTYFLTTGYVLINGKIIGQTLHVCKDHFPTSKPGEKLHSDTWKKVKVFFPMLN